MKNAKLQEILNTYMGKSNKELGNIILTLETDFTNIKNVILELTETLQEVETTYDAVYKELEKRIVR